MKIKYINGLKGICCLIVFLGHMVSLFLPYVYFGASYPMHADVEKILFITPLNILFNAPSALMCFLLLSGFLIPISSFCTEKRISVLTKWIERYMRLMPMALIGCFIGWVVMKFGLVYSYKITEITFSSNYSEWFNNFQPGKIFASDGPICDGMGRTFLIGSRYNAPLGTLKYIWTDSVLLLTINKFCNKWKYRYIMYSILIAASYCLGKIVYENFYFGIMLLGMMLCDYYYNPNKKDKIKRSNIVGGLCLLIGIYLLSVLKGLTAVGIYHWIGYLKQTHYLYWAFGWALIIIAVENLPTVRKCLENSVLDKLGDISFAVFAVHWPVVISLSCIMQMKMLKTNISYMTALGITGIITVVLVLFLAYVIQYLIYDPLYKFEKKIVEILEK